MPFSLYKKLDLNKLVPQPAPPPVPDASLFLRPPPSSSSPPLAVLRPRPTVLRPPPPPSARRRPLAPNPAAGDPAAGDPWPRRDARAHLRPGRVGRRPRPACPHLLPLPLLFREPLPGGSTLSDFFFQKLLRGLLMQKKCPQQFLPTAVSAHRNPETCSCFGAGIHGPWKVRGLNRSWLCKPHGR